MISEIRGKLGVCGVFRVKWRKYVKENGGINYVKGCFWIKLRNDLCF